MGKRKLLKKVKEASAFDVLAMVLGIIAISVALYYTLLQ